MKKIFILIILIILIIAIGVFNRYKITNIENFKGISEKVTILKTKNKNNFLNIFKSNTKYLNTNDLIVYKNPLIFDDNFSKKENILGRVIGLPGDNIKIKNSQVYINDEILNPDYELYFLYRITMSDTTNFNILLQSFDLQINNIINSFACNFIATQNVADNVAKINNVVNIRKIIKNESKCNYDIFPFEPRIFWDADNFGPFIIPKNGTTIKLTPEIYYIYKIALNVYEDNIVVFDNAQFEINGVKVEKYTFKHNYFFVLNDNRYFTKDSRSFGLIPEDQILGKVINSKI